MSMSRRDFARLGASAAAAGLSGVTLAAGEQQGRGGQAGPPPPPPDALTSSYLMDVLFETGGPGGGAVGNRQIVSVTGGTFEGPRLKGKVLPPGGDWLQTVSGNVRLLDVRALLMTDDDQRIYMTYKGVMYTPQGGSLYWRITPYFETGSEKYAWLNSIVCVGIGYTVPTKVPYRIFQIL
jgi:Protein of unknown function (DUF3237)